MNAKNRSPYVGKKFTKLRPNSCEHAMIAKMRTLGSLTASLNPDHILGIEVTRG